MLPAAAKLNYLDRMKMARGIILSELLAKNRLIKQHAKEQAKLDPGLQLSRRRLEELRAGRRGGAAGAPAGEAEEQEDEEERRLAQLLQQEEEEFLQDRGRPFLNVRLRQEVVQAQAEARRRQRLERLHQKWQDDKDYFIKGGRRILFSNEENADGFFVPPDLASQLKRAPKIPDVAKAVEERRNRCTTRSSSTSSTNDADVAPTLENRRCLQSGDIRIIGVTTSMANQTLVKRIQAATVVYDLNQVPVLNRIPIPELLKDDNSYSNDPQLQAADNPYLTMFTLYNFQSRTALVMHQRRGSIFVYDVDSGTGDDIPRGVDFNEVLPPIMRFRFHSCKENDAFCHLQTSTYIKCRQKWVLHPSNIDDGVVVLDRHRMQILEYKWRFFEGVDRVYDRDVESMILRVPQHSLFGQLDLSRGDEDEKEKRPIDHSQRRPASHIFLVAAL
eukprot:g1542.t1